MATSRSLPDIIEEFEPAMTLETRANKKDVRAYFEEQMSRLPRYVLKNTTFQARIVDDIAGAIDGM